jgi:amino acid transporter
VPRSGSAYVYIYVTIGEFVAFVLGWDLILEYLIGVSSGASSIGEYMNSLINNTVATALQAAMPMHVSFLGPFPDFLSFSFVVAITGIDL